MPATALRLAPDAPADALAEPVEGFLGRLIADGRSPLTISAYRRDLERFAGVLAQIAPGVGISDLTTAPVEAVLASPEIVAMPDGTPRSAATTHRLKAALLSFCAWAEETGRVERSPARFVRMRRLPRKPPEFLSAAEVRRLRKELAGRTSDLDRRDRVMIEVLLATGIRLQELVGLDVADVDLDGKHLRLRRVKGGAAQVRFLKTELRSLLRGYLRERRKKASEACEALFLSGRDQRISPRQVEQRVAMWVSRAGITKRIGPHGLRHSFATRLYAATSNLLVVQRALGHRDVSTTQIYTHVVDEELEEALERL